MLDEVYGGAAVLLRYAAKTVGAGGPSPCEPCASPFPQRGKGDGREKGERLPQAKQKKTALRTRKNPLKSPGLRRGFQDGGPQAAVEKPGAGGAREKAAAGGARRPPSSRAAQAGCAA